MRLLLAIAVAGAACGAPSSTTATTASSKAPPAGVAGGWRLLVDAPLPETAGTPRSSTAERGRKLYERRDYLSASIELHKVVAGTSNDDAASRQWAEIELAATLYQLWLDAAAYSFLGRIMQAGEAHAAYREALPWLRAVARSLPAAAGADALLAQHDPSAEAAPVVVEPEDAWVRKLDAELAEFNAMDKAWQSTSVAADILQELTLQRSLADSTRD